MHLIKTQSFFNLKHFLLILFDNYNFKLNKKFQDDEFDEGESSKNKNRKSRKSTCKEKQISNGSIIIDKLQQKRDNLLNTHPMILSIIVSLAIPSLFFDII